MHAHRAGRAALARCLARMRIGMHAARCLPRVCLVRFAVGRPARPARHRTQCVCTVGPTRTSLEPRSWGVAIHNNSLTNQRELKRKTETVTNFAV